MKLRNTLSIYLTVGYIIGIIQVALGMAPILNVITWVLQILVFATAPARFIPDFVARLLPIPYLGAIVASGLVFVTAEDREVGFANIAAIVLTLIASAFGAPIWLMIVLAVIAIVFGVVASIETA